MYSLQTIHLQKINQETQQLTTPIPINKFKMEIE